MIIEEYFKGDSLWMGKIQHDMYWEMLRMMYSTAIHHYYFAEEVVGVRTELGRAIRAKQEPGRYDHRTLQVFHDMMAAQFRFSNLELQEPAFHGVLDDYESDHERVEQTWRAYASTELLRLFRARPELPRLMLVAATYSNPDKRGIEAENRIVEIVEDEYLILTENIK
jgi:hypothetical protein